MTARYSRAPLPPEDRRRCDRWDRPGTSSAPSATARTRSPPGSHRGRQAGRGLRRSCGRLTVGQFAQPGADQSLLAGVGELALLEVGSAALSASLRRLEHRVPGATYGPSRLRRRRRAGWSLGHRGAPFKDRAERAEPYIDHPPEEPRVARASGAGRAGHLRPARLADARCCVGMQAAAAGPCARRAYAGS
jgi:hypothetical protein